MSSKERRDAVRVSDVDSFHTILPHLMPNRTDAEVSLHEVFDVTELSDYLRQANEADGGSRKLFHAFCTAVAKTVYFRPKLNCFISGRRFWMRKDITLSFVAKRMFSDTAEESLMFLKVKPDMTLDQVSHLILGDVEKARREGTNDIGDAMDIVAKLPRFLLTALFAILRRLEYHGIMPKALTNGDPNYSTVLLSNLGSIGCGAPYHHLNNYGTNSVMITIGTYHPEKVMMPDGSEQQRLRLPVTVTLDERIADGFYFARSVRLLQYLLKHPQYLAQRVDTPLPEDCVI